MKFLAQCDTVSGCGHIYPGDMTQCPKCDAPEHFSDDISNTLYASDYVYDIETYPNCFTCSIIHPSTGLSWKFEISDQVNQIESFISFIYNLRDQGARMVGYNNIGFDYPVIHFIVTNPWVSVVQIYDRAMTIIKAHGPAKFAYMIWDRDRIVEQLDVYKIWHYDNISKATSLKFLEIAMRMKNIEDLPFPVGTVLSPEQITELHRYNKHDVVATILFYVRTLSAIKLREDLTAKFGKSFMNDSDVKMGEKILIGEIEDSGIPCYEKINNKRSPRQTIRASIDLGDVIFPYVKFESPQFEKIRQTLASKVITETKGVLADIDVSDWPEEFVADKEWFTSSFKVRNGKASNLHVMMGGIPHIFGTGGLHASVNGGKFESNETHQIVDVDVASFYPNLAIKNKMFPAHLGEIYCDAYLGIYETRKTFAKGTPENGAYKLALNGSYGGSNNVHSPFYDPFYTMQTTINGQLLLCMLVEQMVKIPGLTMIQCNTDGITYFCPREYIDHQRAICKWWEDLTDLELEEALYSRMWVRDVNNYMAEYKPGAVKRIGAYAHVRSDMNPGTREVVYNKDQSKLVVQLAAEAYLANGTPIEAFIRGHGNEFDFMCNAKVPRASNLVMRWSMGDDNIDFPLANIVRYFVSTNGGALVKISPPTGKAGTWKRKPRVADSEYNAVVAELMTDIMTGYKGLLDTDGIPHDERIHTKNKSIHETREMSIQAGLLVTDCSNADLFDWSSLNYDWYIDQAHKLVDCF